jgi:Protein of unknown function (DUF3800)
MCAESQCGEFTIEDLFDLVFPEDSDAMGHLCMVYFSYLDDSKDQNQKKMLVSAGFFATKEEWGKLRVAWNKRLRDDGLEYFKTSEYKMLTGQFARFKTDLYPPPTGREKARQIRSDLQEIMRRIPGIQGIGVALLVDAYAKVASRPEAVEIGLFQGNAYQSALESIMFETVKHVRKKPGQNVVAFVHDDGPDYDELRGYYNAFKNANPNTAKFMNGFQPLDDTKHPPLQAADMVANFTLEKSLEFYEKNQRFDTLEQMQANIQRLCSYDEHYMLSVLKGHLKQAGRPIPSDLQADEYG